MVSACGVPYLVDGSVLGDVHLRTHQSKNPAHQSTLGLSARDVALLVRVSMKSLPLRLQVEILKMVFRVVFEEARLFRVALLARCESCVLGWSQAVNTHRNQGPRVPWQLPCSDLELRHLGGD